MRAKDFIPASKPRNPVVRQQQTSGAGAHRDKKKEQKQGYEKHKGKGVAEGMDAEAYKEKLLASMPQMMRFYEKNVKGWKPSKEQMLAAVETGYTVMKHTSDVKQAGKAVIDELNTLHRMSQGQGVAEGISVVDQDYDLDQVILTLDIEGKRASFTYTDYDENFENAERKDVFDQLQDNSWYKGLDHPTKMEILDAAYKAIRGEEPSEYKPRVDDEPLDMDEEQEMEGRRDYGYDSFGNSLRPGDDEGNTEPPNNFAVYINGKKWKVFQGRGFYADDAREKAHYRQLQDWARKKSADTGKEWKVYITGEKATA